MTPIYMPIRLLLIICILFGMNPTHAYTSERGTKKKIDLFEDDDPLKIELTFNFKKILKNKKEESYHPATIKLEGLTDSTFLQDIEVKARGNFRKGFCHMPPLKLDFGIGDKESNPLKSLGSLKLVSYCKLSPTFQSYVFKEYLIYKLFNKVSNFSFKVRLAEITYIDANGKRKPVTRTGFFIEDIDDLAKRNGFLEVEPKGVATSHIEEEELMRVHMFEYMIGNTDYGLGNLHNLKVVRSKDISKEKLTLIPYDFDYCGMVNTAYAIPNEALNIENVTDRLYLGKCPDERILGKIRMEYLDLKASFFSVIENFTLLDKRSKFEMKEFLEGFYTVIENDKRVNEVFLLDCGTAIRN